MKILTIPEVANILRMSECTVMRLCRKRTIPARKVGRLWRVNEEALAKWINERPKNEKGNAML